MIKLQADERFDFTENTQLPADLGAVIAEESIHSRPLTRFSSTSGIGRDLFKATKVTLRATHHV